MPIPGPCGLRLDCVGVDVLEDSPRLTIAVWRLEHGDVGAVAVETDGGVGPLAADRVAAEDDQTEVGKEGDRGFEVADGDTGRCPFSWACVARYRVGRSLRPLRPRRGPAPGTWTALFRAHRRLRCSRTPTYEAPGRGDPRPGRQSARPHGLGFRVRRLDFSSTTSPATSLSRWTLAACSHLMGSRLAVFDASNGVGLRRLSPTRRRGPARCRHCGTLRTRVASPTTVSGSRDKWRKYAWDPGRRSRFAHRHRP